MGARPDYGERKEGTDVRFVVELVDVAGGRVEGRVFTASGSDPRPFSGWLQLLELLEPQVTEGDAAASGATTTTGEEPE